MSDSRLVRKLPARRRTAFGLPAPPAYQLDLELHLFALAFKAVLPRWRCGDDDELISVCLRSFELLAARHFLCPPREESMGNVVHLPSVPQQQSLRVLPNAALDRLVMIALAIPEARKLASMSDNEEPIELVLAGLAEWVGEFLCPECDSEEPRSS